MLLDLARHAHSFLRRLDCFGRIGGEEFMFILPDTGLAAGIRILEQVFGRTRLLRPLKACPEFSYPCCAGLTELTPGDSAREAFARADKGIYRAKFEGRDRISVI
ncbi:MAG: diguanylate cyclase [Phyllobacterium sp.]|uniref:diguanylate cyclase n=1 Tax=Phyllobacterium sp. TaxID=1871046 RepID=UPI0030F2510F